MVFNFFGNKKVAEKLYEQNLELAVKNKTLSLLEKLYQTSILTSSPEEEGKEITDIIRTSLNLELVGVFIFEKKTDSLEPLIFSKSERLVKTLHKLGFLFHDIVIKDVLRHPLFKKVVYAKEEVAIGDLEEIWQELITFERLQEIKKQSNIKTALLYPLITGNHAFGVLLLGFNRDYQTLSTFEKESIKSSINVIALLLDKAYLYKHLQDSYAFEKKAKEDLQNLDITKNQFLLTIQHHLRTPLTSMMGYADLLVNGAFGKQNKKTLDIIHKFQASTASLIKMVNEFLDITQFQLGKDVIVLKPGIELGPILDEIVGELKFEAESKGIYLKLEKPEKIYTISADKEKLRAALSNIFDNAIKYTVQGGVTIRVESNSGVKIIVKDTGIGIPPERMKNLFERTFERGDQAKKTFATGTGLGLFLSNKIIQGHNGKVWAESKGENQGTTFYIELPVDPVSNKNETLNSES